MLTKTVPVFWSCPPTTLNTLVSEPYPKTYPQFLGVSFDRVRVEEPLQVACFDPPEKLSPFHPGMFKRLRSPRTMFNFSGLAL